MPPSGNCAHVIWALLIRSASTLGLGVLSISPNLRVRSLWQIQICYWVKGALMEEEQRWSTFGKKLVGIDRCESWVLWNFTKGAVGESVIFQVLQVENVEVTVFGVMELYFHYLAMEEKLFFILLFCASVFFSYLKLDFQVQDWLNTWIVCLELTKVNSCRLCR